MTSNCYMKNGCFTTTSFKQLVVKSSRMICFERDNTGYFWIFLMNISSCTSRCFWRPLQILQVDYCLVFSNVFSNVSADVCCLPFLGCEKKQLTTTNNNSSNNNKNKNIKAVKTMRNTNQQDGSIWYVVLSLVNLSECNL